MKRSPIAGLSIAGIVVFSVVLLLLGFVEEADLTPSEARLRFVGDLGLLASALGLFVFAPLPSPHQIPGAWLAASSQPPTGPVTLGYEAAFLSHFRKRAFLVGSILLVTVAVEVAVNVYVIVNARSGLLRTVAIAFTSLLALVGIACPLVACRYWRRLLAFRMEPTEQGLRLAWATEAAESVPWSKVFWDGHTILAGRRLLVVRESARLPRFSRESFEQSVLPRIPSRNLVDRRSLMLHAIRKRNPLAVSLAAVFAVAAVLCLVDSVLR